MIKRLTKILLYLVFFFPLLLVLVPQALAQTELSTAASQNALYDLSVNPPTSYLRIHPGNVALHTITLKNNGQTTISVLPKIVDFVSDGSTGQPILSKNSSFPYLDLNKTSIEKVQLPPGKTAQLTLHFSVPSTAENREFPLTVLFEAKLPDEPELETKVTGTIGSNLVVLVSDSDFLDQQFTIDSFSNKPFIDSFQPLQFSPAVKNNTFAASIASGSAKITNWQGTVVAQYDILPEVILGYSTRNIQPIAVAEDPNTLEENNNGQRVFSFKSAFLFGPHTISVYLPSGDPSNPQLIEYKKVVWAIPIAVLIAILVALILISMYYVYRKRNFTDM